MLKKIAKACRKHRAAAVPAFCLAAVLAVVMSRGCGKGLSESDRVEDVGLGAPEAVLTPLQAEVDRSEEFTGNPALGILRANVWVNAAETCALDFDEHTFTERKDGQETSVSFAVVNIHEETGTAWEGTVEIGETSWLIDCLGADGAFFFIELDMTGAGDESEITVRSEAFSHGAYLRIAPTDNIELLEFGPEASRLIDGRERELALALCDWCALYYPTATRAAFAGEATIDYGARVVEMDFTLDNGAKTVIAVVYAKDTGEFRVGRAR